VRATAGLLASGAVIGWCQDGMDDHPLFHALLEAFGRRTGVPVLLNTSFNDRDEPIVCSAEDALRSFLRMDLDALVVGRSIVRRAQPACRPDNARRAP
jgi:Carbamoyltransferase C-terminus